MKKVFLFVLMISAMFMLASCGSKSNYKLTPTSKKINGPLGKFFEVVEREYKINGNELSVEFKRIAEGGPTDASWSTHPTFSVEIQDEDGNSIASRHTDVVLTEEQLEAVFSLGVDETASITFKFNEDKIKDAAKFKVSSKWEKAEAATPVQVLVEEDGNHDSDETDRNISLGDDDDDSESVNSSSGSENWDSVLDSYERYVDKYIALMKKAQSGDASAMSEYPSLMQEAQEYGDKLQNAKGSLSASQMARYQRITNKMLKAAQ